MNFLSSPYYRYLLLAVVGALMIAGGYAMFLNGQSERIEERCQRILQQEITNYEAEIIRQLEDSSFLARSMDQTNAFDEFLQLNEGKPYSILIYRNGELRVWSGNEIIPTNINRVFKQKYNFVKLNNAWYEVIRKDYEPNTIALGILPVYYIYPITNRYLQEGFHFEHDVLDLVKVATAETDHVVNSYDGQPLFYLDRNEQAQEKCPPLIWWLQVIGILLLLSSGIRWSARLVRRSAAWKGVLLLAVTLAAGILLHYTDFLLYTRFSGMFSSRVYASSSFIPSLGILLVYSLTSLVIAFFVTRYIRLPKVGRMGVMSDIYLLLLYLFNTVVFILLVFIIKSVVDNSTISFDFYNFYTLSVYSLAGLSIFAMWFTILFLVMNKTAAAAMDFASWKLLFIAIICCAVVYLPIRHLTFVDPWWVTLFFMLILAYFFLSESGALKFNFINYLIIISIFAWTTAHIITTHIASKQFDKQKDFISELLFERDLSEEFQLMESGSAILQDNFIKRYFRSPYLTDYDLEERLKSRYFSRFEGRYNIHVYAFNNSKLPLKGESEKSFQHLTDLYRNEANNTVSTNIRYFSGSNEALKYLIYYPILQGGDRLGYMYVEVIPKVFGSSSAYPELLIAGYNSMQPAEDEYEYAIYKYERLQKSRGDYEYTAALNFDYGGIGEYIFYNDRDYHHLVYNNGDEIIVVLSKRRRSIISPFSAFSYTFCFYLVVLLLYWLLGLRDVMLNDDQPLEDVSPATLQRRIQISMISLVLSSLFIIGVVTLIYFQNQYNTYHNARLLRKANALVKNLDAYVADEYPDNLSEAQFESVVSERIFTLANIHSLDLNVYSSEGRLMITSQPDIFSKELVSTMIHPEALLHLDNKGKSRHVQDEKVGALNYLSAYLPYMNSEGERIAFLHFPYYSKQQSFRADISYFLVALVNVYVLLILTATAIALLLSRSITNSLTMIKERLSTIKLREKNVPIEWKNKDEIGMLVEEYNRMIVELEKSAELLAKSERETAWREMAKQVAHEIKNPLTPMKLSIQHLQRALKEGRPDTKELTEQVSNRLIEQIDNLTHIASEFSSFASMPAAKFEKVDLREVIHSTAALFQNLQHLTVTEEVPDNPCWVLVDKNQMIGVFNNLLKNASQAISDEVDGRIDLRIIEKQDVFRIEVEDNGVGIPEEKKGRVFEPNFTTKSSGTGLGLAISRNIIEKSKGSIWFDSQPGKGTIFYLVLPKHDEED